MGDRVVDEVEHGLAEVCAIHAYLCVFYERDDRCIHDHNFIMSVVKTVIAVGLPMTLSSEEFTNVDQ